MQNCDTNMYFILAFLNSCVGIYFEENTGTLNYTSVIQDQFLVFQNILLKVSESDKENSIESDIYLVF